MNEIANVYDQYKSLFQMPKKILINLYDNEKMHHVIDYLHFHTPINVEKIRRYHKAQHVIDNEERYKKLYSILADEKSRKTLICILKYRLNGKMEDLHDESDYILNQYFDRDIMKFNNNEVFVDCGGYIGDTAGSFINRVDDFKKIYIYEPNPENNNFASQMIRHYPKEKRDKVIIRTVGVGKEGSSNLKLLLKGSGSSIAAKGDCDVSIVSIDDDISESISVIKMDIEGFEMNALIGAKNHICSDHPKLAICVYHKPEDLLEIPEYILSLDSTYKLYLRQYYFIEDWETVLYAI